MSSTDCYVAKNKKTFVPDNNGGPDESFHVIYIECATCFVARHPYAGDGQGCSFWRRSDSLHESAHCCEFIYDQNCGASPKYKMYNPTCTWRTPTIMPVAVEGLFAFSLDLP
ncbi:uncharacterized protein LOC142564800 [Dermacentor variabilis]|uniref:uncharacterized protein LOC142564800 n=1 Tax=Dermacentor variabilis TaxID=34621 RepID=UPI003F5C1833